MQPRDLDGDTTTVEAWYDTALDITWLADSIGLGWEEATTWVSSLDYGGVDDWRLPTITPVDGSSLNYVRATDGSSDHGYNFGGTESELAHMYYTTLGNLADIIVIGEPQLPGTGLTNTGPFDHFNLALSSINIWIGVESELEPERAWSFAFLDGYQTPQRLKDLPYHAWAVHDGDVGVAAVPVPPAAWLFGSALVALSQLPRRC